MATTGFPNMFVIDGPQSPSVFSNMVTSAEQHAAWVSDCVAYLEQHDIGSIEATAEAEASWVQHVTDLVTGTLHRELAELLVPGDATSPASRGSSCPTSVGYRRTWLG